MQNHPSLPGPIAMPKAFRRPTGAHAIIAAVLIADLVGLAFWMLLCALAAPTAWWLLRHIPWSLLLHTSRVLDICIVLFSVFFGIGLLRHRGFKQRAADAWGILGPLCIVIAGILLILLIWQPSWISTPLASTPIVTLTLLPQAPPASVPLAAGAAALSILAHLLLWRHAHTQEQNMLASLSRAHADGEVWIVIDHAYQQYKKALKRFEHPPVWPLKTPATFFYYPPAPQTDTPSNPEREFLLVNGEMVINQKYIGTQKEQMEILFPLLARLLSHYHNQDHLVERIFYMADLADASRFYTVLLLLPLWVTTFWKPRWQSLERDRVLDKDFFAYQLGEGKRLNTLLLQQRDLRLKNSQPDNAVPTLAERIDHLESLLRRESRQIKELRAALPAPPSTS